MKNIRIDQDGVFRCWKCGAKAFKSKRTMRSKVIGGTAGVLTLGIGAAPAVLATKKKLQCLRCNEYNDTGKGQPYDGPDSRKFKKEYQTELAARQNGTYQPVPTTIQ